MANTATTTKSTRTRKTKAQQASAEQAPVDLPSLVASGQVTIEVIDVATAQLDPNIRSEATYTPEFVDSIRAEGVREPVYARRGDDGTVYVWDGQRRTLAAKEAGTATMLGIFGLTPATVADSQRVLDQLRTFNRADLTLTDRITAYEQLALDGISEAQIARAAGDSTETVKKSITAAKSATAKQVAKDHGQVSLDKLILIAEFDGDEEAVDRITWADESEIDLDYLAQSIRDDRATAKAEAALIEKYTSEGYRVITTWQTGLAYLERLTDAAADAQERPMLTPEQHVGCPGRTLYLSVWGAGEDDYRTEELCCEPGLHQPRYGTLPTVKATRPDESDEDREAREEAEAEAKRAERRRVIANNKAWKTATTVRRDWIVNFLTRKTLPKDAGVFVALSLTEHVNVLTEYKAADLLGAFLSQEDGYQHRTNAAKLVTAHPTKAGHVSLAVALAAREARAEDVQGWRSVSPVIASYLLALEAWGYKLSPVEKIAAGYTEDEPNTTEESATDQAATEEAPVEESASEEGESGDAADGYTVAVEDAGKVTVIAEVEHHDLTETA